MFRLYTPILLLQAICVWHAYKNNSEQKWIYLIVIFPFIGCLIYLYFHFSGKLNIDNITETVKEAVNNDYQMEQLEKENRFADTAANKIRLGDEYMQKGRYADALQMYESCLNGIYNDDPELLRKLIQANYLTEDYKSTIEFGKQLENDYGFKNSQERIAYAWALFYENKLEEAEQQFIGMDLQFTNYHHRMEFCKMLIEQNRLSEAKDKLGRMKQEIEHMDAPERRAKRKIYSMISEMYQEI
ncbi:MAG: PLDc N-terminal domain-containing protein [Bacteroidota bacterium]